MTYPSLRLSPSIPYVERIAEEDDVIPLSEPIMSNSGTLLSHIAIQKGQAIQLPYVAINRLGWADGDVFHPGRWLDEKTQPAPGQLPRGWSGTLAFGDGPRNCVGFRLGMFSVYANIDSRTDQPAALFETKVILTSLIRKFSFHDTGAAINFKVAASIQAYVRGREDQGPQLPMIIRVL
jgi:hypothetical protein